MPNSNDEIKPTLLTPARTRGNSFSISATARLFLHLAPYLLSNSNKKNGSNATHTHPIYAPQAAIALARERSAAQCMGILISLFISWLTRPARLLAKRAERADQGQRTQTNNKQSISILSTHYISHQPKQGRQAGRQSYAPDYAANGAASPAQ